ncbi:lysylphosphatidylglycerol synthase domain-containing protein [Desulfofundulus thermosubterraneus]|uniref:Phosphatidylglycerol lysyltransferase n=1 Tax=Desulfofundulus thermosubterraneus DSM 16057 TaxID=1121432 RepID=A0A1M6FU16_9FIRM|nr:lysylphosphatidylglycerol synthase domain-containing protein [Desulfofundulus thermosubterraneus]SHJ01119.1 hypothetical protein SAMN02745219_01548 [Desulfofundulus thermosubterraneus DSM 16057]
MRISLKKLGIPLTLLATGFFIRYFIEQFHRIPALGWSAHTLLVLLFTTFLSALCVGLGGVIWQVLLRSLGVNTAWQRIQVIYSVGQFAKYLPGNVGQHFGRVFMAREVGIPTSATVQTMFQEISWGVAVGAGLTLFSLLYLIEPGKLPGVRIISIALLFLATLFLPWVAIRLINGFFPSLGSRFTGGERLVVPTLGTLVKVIGLFLLCFLLVGIVLDVQARFLFGQTESRILVLTSLFAVSWIAGYLTPGAPAGLGVRESVLVLLLSSLYGSGVAVGLSLTLRVATTLGDGLAFALGLLGWQVSRVREVRQ